MFFACRKSKIFEHDRKCEAFIDILRTSMYCSINYASEYSWKMSEIYLSKNGQD